VPPESVIDARYLVAYFQKDFALTNPRHISAVVNDGVIETSSPSGRLRARSSKVDSES
jgi:hypothetical protein